MEPRIQYAKTTDGVRFAFTAFGNGPPLLLTSAAVYANVAEELQFPALRAWCDRLASRHTLILYDGRAGASSDSPQADLALEAHTADLEAIADRLGIESLDLFGFYHTSLAAIVYAARHPEKVRKLVLWHSYEKASDLSSPQLSAVRSMRDMSWDVYTETLARTSFGWTEDENASRWARIIRQSTTPERVARWLEFAAGFDVSPYLPQVRCPTLLMYRKDARRYSADLGIALASQIPGAQLQLLPGEAMMYFGAAGSDRVAELVADFLSDSDGGSVAPYGTPGSIVTILFVQVEDRDGLVDNLGDERATSLLADRTREVREQVRRHGGAEVKPMGDGFVSSFASAYAALECAIDLQRVLESQNEVADEPVRLKLGLNAGEPMAENDDLFGSAVIMAARTASKAKGGEIFVTDVVRQLAAGKGFLFSDLGETDMRGFEDPVRLFELGWRTA